MKIIPIFCDIKSAFKTFIILIITLLKICRECHHLHVVNYKRSSSAKVAADK